jgi:Zn-finger nucleic acid-binding protein
MKCPVCIDPDLVMTFRDDIEIDYCPRCRGIWLDRGELDKIIERATAQSHGHKRERFRHEDESYRPYYPEKKRKRESFFEDLFDF